MKVKVKSLSTVLTLCDPMDCSLPGSSLHGILQARILEWVAISFSRGSSQPMDQTQVSTVDGFFTIWATREGHALIYNIHAIYIHILLCNYHFPGGSGSKASVCNAGDLGSTPGLGRSPGEGNGNPLQYSCLENPMDRGAWCRLLSMGSQRVGHDWATSLSPFCV